MCQRNLYYKSVMFGQGTLLDMMKPRLTGLIVFRQKCRVGQNSPRRLRQRKISLTRFSIFTAQLKFHSGKKIWQMPPLLSLAFHRRLHLILNCSKWLQNLHTFTECRFGGPVQVSLKYRAFTFLSLSNWIKVLHR